MNWFRIFLPVAAATWRPAAARSELKAGVHVQTWTCIVRRDMLNLSLVVREERMSTLSI